MTIPGPDARPARMRAIPLDQFGPPDVLAVREVPVPTPGPGQILVKVAACGVCGQDVMRRQGQVDRVLGATMGHEIAGTVVAAGEGVTRHAVGDRVAGLQRRACHRCRACLGGDTQLCMSGVLYGESVDGGYADYCVVDELSLARIPDTVPFVDAAVAACAVGTGLHALRLAGVSAGQRVLVTGASGGVGLHALQLARAMGAEVVAVTSSPEKAEVIANHADEVVCLEDGRFDPQVRARSLQPDVVLDMTARMTLPDSLRSVKRGGTVVIVGNLDNSPVQVLPAAFIIRELRLIGSKAATMIDLEDSLGFIERGAVTVKKHGLLPLEKAADAHRLVESRNVTGRIVLEV